VRKLDALHNYDCLRANKSMMAWGVEPRVPFLDREFLDVAMRFDAAHKMVGAGDGGRRIEKAVLREAFDGYLPDSILWRQKEQFSDGVGYGWIDGLKAHAEAQVSDRELAAADKRFQPAADQGGVLLPPPVRAVLPEPRSRRDRAGRQVDRLFVAGGHCLGRQLRRGCRSSGRAIAGVHEQALAYAQKDGGD
jgi:asparagine synthase (glutamine-hydrolysing)